MADKKEPKDSQDFAALIATKILKVMGSVKSVAKDGKNAFHGYSFASDAAILTAVRVAMIEHKLVAIPNQVSCERVGELTTLCVEYTIIDAETGYSFQSRVYGQGQDKSDKGAYKAATGAEKYFLLKALMIPTGDDPEADTPPQKPAARASGGRGRAEEAPPEQEEPAAPAALKDDVATQGHAKFLIEQFTTALDFPTLEKLGTDAKAAIGKMSKPLQDKVRAAYLDKKTKLSKLQK